MSWTFGSDGDLDHTGIKGMRIPLLSRRQALATAAVGFGDLALRGLLADEGPAGSPIADSANANPLAPRRPHMVPRAKRIIFLFMSGGPSQVDTFDPKPLLTRDDGKPFPFAKPRVQFNSTGNLLKSPWSFRQYGESGIWVSDLFPHMARHVDDFCMIHSVHGTNPAHGGALLMAAVGPALPRGWPAAVRAHGEGRRREPATRSGYARLPRASAAPRDPGHAAGPRLRSAARRRP